MDTSQYGKDFLEYNYNVESNLPKEFEECSFNNCSLNEDFFDQTTFINCRFINCDMSNFSFVGTTFIDVNFENCKMLGTDFRNSINIPFAVNFDDSILNYAIFTKKNMTQGSFNLCEMKECDFTESNLSKASFDNCNLLGAVFSRTNIEKTDFSTSNNISLDPEFNKVKGAIFSSQSLAGLLTKYRIKIV